MAEDVIEQRRPPRLEEVRVSEASRSDARRQPGQQGYFEKDTLATIDRLRAERLEIEAQLHKLGGRAALAKAQQECWERTKHLPKDESFAEWMKTKAKVQSDKQHLVVRLKEIEVAIARLVPKQRKEHDEQEAKRDVRLFFTEMIDLLREIRDLLKNRP